VYSTTQRQTLKARCIRDNGRVTVHVGTKEGPAFEGRGEGVRIATTSTDYETSPFDLHWIEKYKDEIFYSVEVLDEFLGELRRFCDETRRVLIVVTSMGQCANPSLDKSQGQDIVIESLPILLRRLGIDDTKCDILSAMVQE
jgi:hypothetical protein